MAARRDPRGRAHRLGRRRRQRLRRASALDRFSARAARRGHRLAHRHGARRAARSTARSACIAGLECLHTIGEQTAAAPAPARGRGVERRGGALRQPLRLPRVLRHARRRQDPGDGRRRRREAGGRRWHAPASIRRASPTRRSPAGAVPSYVELHIEQGPRLEEAGIDHRRRRVHRGRPALAHHLPRPGRPRRHDADGAPARRVPRRRRVRAARARARGDARAAGAA